MYLLYGQICKYYNRIQFRSVQVPSSTRIQETIGKRYGVKRVLAFRSLTRERADEFRFHTLHTTIDGRKFRLRFVSVFHSLAHCTRLLLLIYFVLFGRRSSKHGFDATDVNNSLFLLLRVDGQTANGSIRIRRQKTENYLLPSGEGWKLRVNDDPN